MSNTFYSLYAGQTYEDCWVLWENPADAPFRIREEYHDLACPACGRLDTLAALQRGIGRDVKGPVSRVDAEDSQDAVRLVSRRARDVLEAVPGVDVHFFPLPGDPRYFAMHPKHMFYPPPDARLYGPVEKPTPGEAFQVRGAPCPKCKRPKCTTFVTMWFVPPPETVLAAASVEVGDVEGISWIGSQAVVDAIRKNKLTGWRIDKMPGPPRKSEPKPSPKRPRRK